MKERLKGDEQREREASYSHEEREREGGKLREWERGREIERVGKREGN